MGNGGSNWFCPCSVPSILSQFFHNTFFIIVVEFRASGWGNEGYAPFNVMSFKTSSLHSIVMGLPLVLGEHSLFTGLVDCWSDVPGLAVFYDLQCALCSVV